MLFVMNFSIRFIFRFNTVEFIFSNLNRTINKKEIIKMNVYVGNLNYDLSEDDLKQAFEEFGEVTSAKIISDRYSGRSKGFGFVEMSSDDEAKAAIEALSGKELNGRTMVVNEARPKTQ